RANAILANIALVRIARVGHSLVLRLRRELLPVVSNGDLGRAPGIVDLLDSPLVHQIRALLPQRPRFFQEDKQTSRPFQTLDDLEIAKIWVLSAMLLPKLAPKTSMPACLGQKYTFGDCFRTDTLNNLLGRKGPLDRRTLITVLKTLVKGNTLAPEVRDSAHKLVIDRLGKKTDPLALTVVDQWVDDLESAIVPLQPEKLDLRFVSSLVLGGSMGPKD
ncbi:MAG: DUF6178 family protein, partial [Pseudomonadota bacterium]